MCSYKKRFKNIRIGTCFTVRGELGTVYLKIKKKDIWFMLSVNAVAIKHPKQGFKGIEVFIHSEHLVKTVRKPRAYKMVRFEEVSLGQRFRIDPDLPPNLRKLHKSRLGKHGAQINSVSSNRVEYACRPDLPCYVEVV